MALGMQANEYTWKAVLVKIGSQFNPIPDESWVMHLGLDWLSMLTRILF